MNTNFGIYNYLNLVNRRVAKAFRSSGRSPLPEGFTITKEKIMERLYLNQMQSDITFPSFLFEDSRAVKKRFKASVKQIKQLQAMYKKPEYAKTLSSEFSKKFETYLNLRLFVTKSILKEFKRYFFNECDAYEEICAIDTIFFRLLDGTFEPDFDVRLYVDGLEKKYNIIYQESVSRLEEKVSEKTKKKRAEQILMHQQAIDYNIDLQKNEAKMIKDGMKTEKKEAKINKSRELYSFKQEKEHREQEEYEKK